MPWSVFERKYCQLHARNNVERWCQIYHFCAASRDPRIRCQGLICKYTISAPFERIAIDITGPFLESRRGNKYLRIAREYSTKWPKLYTTYSQQASASTNVQVSQLLLIWGPEGITQRPRPELRVTIPAVGVMASQMVQDAHRPSSSRVRQHNGTLH